MNHISKNVRVYQNNRKHRQDSLKSLRSDNSRTSSKPPNVSAATLDALSDTTSIMSGSASSSAAAAALDEDGNLFLDPSQCFSIIFRGDWTLDLMLLSPSSSTSSGLASGGGTSRDEILDSLDMILKTYQHKKENVSNDVLLLRYVWMDADRVRIASYIMRFISGRFFVHSDVFVCVRVELTALIIYFLFFDKQRYDSLTFLFRTIVGQIKFDHCQ